MERGLIWLPLLGLIIGLTWIGWREYQKVEGYRIWSTQFEQAKYDIYSIIGVKDNKITWGKPTAKGIIGLETFDLENVENIELKLGDRTINVDNLPEKKVKDTPQLAFNFKTERKAILIPFTELDLAAKWQKYLASKYS